MCFGHVLDLPLDVLSSELTSNEAFAVVDVRAENRGGVEFTLIHLQTFLAAF